MKIEITRNAIVEICAALLIILFGYTALDKFYNHHIFQITLTKSPIIHSVAPIVSWVIPVVEILIVAGLFFIRTRLFAFYTSFFLLILFTTYIAYMVKFVPNLPCSCGGVIAKLSWGQHIIFNSFFILVSLIPIVIQVLNEQKRNYKTASLT